MYCKCIAIKSFGLTFYQIVYFIFQVKLWIQRSDGIGSKEFPERKAKLCILAAQLHLLLDS